MDPLSISASGVAIGTLLYKLSQELHDIQKTLKDAPDSLHALINEVEDLRLVLASCGTALDAQDESLGLLSRAGLPAAKGSLKKVEAAVQELDRLIQSCGPVPREGTRIQRAKASVRFRAKWLRLQKKIGGVQESLRKTKETLHLHLLATNVSATAEMQTRIESISIGVEQIHVGAFDSKSILQILHASSSRQRSGQSPTSCQDIGESEDTHNGPNVSDSSNGSTGFCPEYDSTIGQGLILGDDTMDEDFQDAPEHLNVHQTGRQDVVTVRISTPQGTCQALCSCCCHERGMLRMPQVLSGFIGSLAIGYVGVPWLTPPCNEYWCRNRSSTRITAKYQFPTWFWTKAWQLAWLSDPFQPPERLLRERRIVPSDAPAFYAVCVDDVALLCRLFDNQLASPNDEDCEGKSLLYYAVESLSGAVVSCLLEWGADESQESNSGVTPKMLAWATDVTCCLPSNEMSRLRKVPHVSRDSTGFQFSPIHKCVFDLSPTSLQQQLQLSTADIDKADRTGSTPLFWAAERGDIRAVSTLLAFGADLTAGQPSGFNPFHAAAGLGHTEIVQLFLTPPEAQDGQAFADWTSKQAVPGVMISSRDAGSSRKDRPVNVDIPDKSGFTALDYSAANGHVATTRALLDAGATIRSDILEICIGYESPSCIPLLLARGADHLRRDLRGRTLLHDAIEKAHLQTLIALYSTDLAGLDVDALDDTGWSATDCAREGYYNQSDKPGRYEVYLLAMRLIRKVRRDTLRKRRHGGDQLDGSKFLFGETA